VTAMVQGTTTRRWLSSFCFVLAAVLGVALVPWSEERHGSRGLTQHEINKSRKARTRIAR
jgi:hypothetical protein